MTKQPKGLKPGIYFDLDAEQYHDDPALSNSGMVQLLKSDRDFWERSPFNPNRLPHKKTPAMERGEKLHMMLLENKKFYKTYNVTGQSYDPKKKLITNSEYQDLKKARSVLMDDQETAAYFTHGMPEVSIVWNDQATGLNLRCRIDYLRYYGCVDFKQSAEIDPHSLGRSIAKYGYDMQCVLYKRGLDEIKRLLRNGEAVVQGKVNREWLDRFTAESNNMFVFFFQRSTPPYIFTIRYLDPETLSNGETCVNAAMDRYKYMLETYGADKPWPYGKVEPSELSGFFIPKLMWYRGLDL